MSDVDKVKCTDKENIKNRVKMLQNENNALKIKLKNKDIYKINRKSKVKETQTSPNKDISKINRRSKDKTTQTSPNKDGDPMVKSENKGNTESGMMTSQDGNRDLTEQSENKDVYKVKYKDKNIKSKKRTLQDKDDSTEQSENENTSKLKSKDENIRKRTLQEDSYLTGQSENENYSKVKDKKIKSRKRTLQDKDNDSTEQSKHENTSKLKSKDENIRKRTLQEDSYLTEQSENENFSKVKDKKIKSRKRTLQDKDNDSTEQSKNETVSKVKYKEKIRKRTLQAEDNDSTEQSENETVFKVEIKDKNIGKRTLQKDSYLTGQSENENVFKVKDENIKSRKRTLQDEDNDSTEQSENKNIKSRKRTLQDEGSGSTEQSENENAFKLKYKNCSDATYLAEQIVSAEQLCEADAAKLYNIRVQLRHMVLPQHEIETRAGSHMPMRKEIEEFERIGPLRRGSYSSDEDEIIVHNWKIFCKLHNWDKTKVRPFLQLRIGNVTYMRNTKERRKFVQFLADGLPDRTLYSVYHRFKNLYENNLQRRYRPEEDQMIIDHLEHNPSLDQRCKYSALAKVLRRTRNSIWRRYKILKKRETKTP